MGPWGGLEIREYNRKWVIAGSQEKLKNRGPPVFTLICERKEENCASLVF